MMWALRPPSAQGQGRLPGKATSPLPRVVGEPNGLLREDLEAEKLFLFGVVIRLGNEPFIAHPSQLLQLRLD